MSEQPSREGWGEVRTFFFFFFFSLLLCPVAVSGIIWIYHGPEESQILGTYREVFVVFSYGTNSGL